MAELKFDTKKLERQMKDSLTALLIDKDGDKMKERVDRLMDKIYATVTSTRHKAKGKEPVGNFSQYGVPVDTGRLKSSIKKLPTIKSNGHIIGRIIQDSSIAPYGQAVEFGHASRAKNGGWVAPQSYMRSARYKHKDDIKNVLK